MADIINLRSARKVRARDAKEAQSTANRAAFGRTKAQKAADAQDAALRAALLDGAKLE